MEQIIKIEGKKAITPFPFYFLCLGYGLIIAFER